MRIVRTCGHFVLASGQCFYTSLFFIHVKIFQMGNLSIEFVKRHCVLILKIEMPLQTIERLMDFFSQRKISVDSLHMHAIEGGEANVMVYCLIEKDRIAHTRSMLEKMRGVLELQVLENKETNTMKHGI
jgi:hypothetical protein